MSSKKTQTMIEQNNVLREKLIAENKAYYEQLLLYIRTHGLFYNDDEVETLLLQILQDILSAQTDGQTAEDFFGSNPQEAANELIGQLGKASQIEILKMVGIIFGISSFWMVLSVLTEPKVGLSGLALILNAFLSFIAVELVFLILHKSVYSKLIKNKKLDLVLFGCAVALFIGLSVLIQRWTVPFFTIYPPNMIVVPLLALTIIAASVFISRCGKKGKALWGPFLPSVYVFLLIGIAARLPWTEDWMTARTGRLTAVVLVIGAYIVFLGCTWLNARRKKKAA
ncbi:MAG: hypothetical protein ABF868_06600 [Sporolactobacillus sp.]